MLPMESIEFNENLLRNKKLLIIEYLIKTKKALVSLGKHV